MSEDLHELVQHLHAFYEVLPYYILLEARKPGTMDTTRRIQAGFDVDIYGTRIGQGSEPPPGYALAYAAAQEIASTISSHTSDACSIEVIPFGSTVILDTTKHFQPEGMLRIRITHGRGLDQPAGAAEESALKEVQEQLHALGVKRGRG
jgi:hypothetical protein